LSTLLSHYIADPAVATLVLNWTARVSALAFGLFLFVAQYDAWTEQREKRIRAERELDSVSETGPQVWLGFQNSPSYVGFTDENRSPNLDAIAFSVDAFETNGYRAAPTTLGLLRHGDTQALNARMFDKRAEVDFIDIELGEMLKEIPCSLQFTLRYQDSWGNRYLRRASIEAHRIEPEIGDLPLLVNHAIERARERGEFEGSSTSNSSR
jgi:hypothetical protein